MAYEDDEEFYADEPETTGGNDYWEPLPEQEPPPELPPEEEEPDVETAPPYQVAGLPTAVPSQRGQAAADDEWERMPPGGFKPSAASAAKDDEFEKVPTKQAADDEWEKVPPGGFKLEEPNRRGLVERVKSGFKTGYEPMLEDIVKNASPEFTEQYPRVSRIIQNVIDQSPVGWSDKALAAITGIAHAAGGALAAGVEYPVTGYPAASKGEADRLQAEASNFINFLMTGMGLPGGIHPPTQTGVRPRLPLREAPALPPETGTAPLPLEGGATRTPQQGQLPLEPPQDQYRQPQPELPLRTPTGEQGQLPLPGEAAPTPAGRVAPGGELVTPPARELPGPGGRIAEQTEMPLAPPTGREPAPREPVRQGELLPPTGEQGQLPFPHEEAPTAAGRTERHGTPGATAAPGTAEAQPPPRMPGPGEPGWLIQARGPEDYGKKTPARGAGGGMNVGEVDPTIASALKSEPRALPTAAEAPARDAAAGVQPEQARGRPLEGEVFAPGEQIPQFPRSPTAAETAQTPPTPSHPRLQEAVARANTARQAAARSAEAVRGPIPETTPGAQKPGGNIVRPLEERPTGELIRLARQGEVSPFMRDSLANELERRGIRRMPEPARAEPPNVGAQLRAREEAARRATQEATAPGPARQFLQDERGGGQPFRQPMARISPQEMVRREPVERGRSGRPIRTEPLPIGTEQAILERGYEKATGPRRTPENIQTRIRQLEYDRNLARKRGEDVTGENYATVRNELTRLRQELRDMPPIRQAAAREGPKLTSFERAKKMTNEQLQAEIARADIPRVQKAVFTDALRARGEKPAVVGGQSPRLPPPTPSAGAAAAPPIKLPGRLSALTERFKKTSTLTPADKAIQDRIAPDRSWTDNIPTTLEGAANLIHRGYEGIFNSVHPMARSVARAERALGRKLETQEDYHRLARSIKGLGGKIESIYREGPFDPETRKIIGPALDPILEKIMVDKDSFNRYSVARRTVEQEGKGLKTGVPLKEANEIVARDGKRWGQTFQELQEFKSAMMRMAKHLIGEENIKKIEELNKDHVPFYRALDPGSEMGDMFRTGGGLGVKQIIEKYKGSERQILDPMNSVLKNMALFADLAEKNEVWRAMERTNKELIKAGKDPLWVKSRSDSPLQVTPEQRTRMIEAGIPEDMVEKMRYLDAKQFAPESKKIRYFENGKEQIRDVREDIGRVAAGMDRASWGLVVKIAGAPKRMLTAGATLNPDFPTKNLFRDQHTAFIQHDAKLRDNLKGDLYIPFYDAAMSVQRFFKPEVAAEFNKWMRNGGANSNLVSFDRKLLSMEPRSFAGKLTNVITHPWQIPRVGLDVLRGASEQLENATRFGAHLRDIKGGRDSPTSAFRQRELTVDFPRMGNFAAIRLLSETIPFFNPQLQGMDRYVRSYKNNPTATFVKTIATITVPSVMLWMYNNKDDPRYGELPMWRKMLFWNIMTDKWRDVTPELEKQLKVDATDSWFRKDPQTGRTQYNYGTIYSWPKPFIEGQLAGSIPERIMEAWFQHKPDAMKHVSDSVIDALLPNYIPQIMVPTIEGAMNYSTFLKRPLMGEGVEKKPQEQQFTRNTSETAKTIAGAFRTILGKEPAAQLGSPIIIQNYIRQLTGGLGDYAVKLLSDPLLNLASGKTPPPGPEGTMADIPIIKGFVSRFPTSGAESIQNFYELRKDAQREKAGGDQFVDIGKPFADLLKAQRDGLERIYTDKQMSPEDKRTSIDVGTLLMIETARKGVDYMRKMNEAAGQARERTKKQQKELVQ